MSRDISKALYISSRFIDPNDLIGWSLSITVGREAVLQGISMFTSDLALDVATTSREGGRPAPATPLYIGHGQSLVS